MIFHRGLTYLTNNLPEPALISRGSVPRDCDKAEALNVMIVPEGGVLLRSFE